ncbi:unnamed protein product, partial [Prorocentrum cordatum]
MDDKELEVLVASLGKAGDAVGAKKFQAVLDARRAPVLEVPVERKVNQAFHTLRAAEQRLQKNVTLFTNLEQSLEAQRKLVVVANDEYKQAELEHQRLVAELAKKSGPKAGPPPKPQVTVKDIMDGKTHELITLGDMFSFGDDEYELSTEDKQAADSLVEQLNAGLKEATTKVFAEAAAA